MTTTTYYYDGDKLVEQSCSDDEVIQSVIHRDEISLLRGKSKRQLADMYMRGVISAETFEEWCNE